MGHEATFHRLHVHCTRAFSFFILLTPYVEIVDRCFQNAAGFCLKDQCDSSIAKHVASNACGTVEGFPLGGSPIKQICRLIVSRIQDS